VAGDPRIRASDADRDRAATLLSKHHAAGRLNSAEFQDRLEKAMEAATIGELDELMADLPTIDVYDLPDASLRRRPRENPRQSVLPFDPDSAFGALPAAGLGGAGLGAGRGGAGPGSGSVARDGSPGPLEGLSPGVTAAVAWATVATALVLIGLVTAIAIGSLVPIWAFVVIPAGGLFWWWFLTRRSRR
jgi:Domain of unknown function (DUF1707)